MSKILPIGSSFSVLVHYSDTRCSDRFRTASEIAAKKPSTTTIEQTMAAALPHFNQYGRYVSASRPCKPAGTSTTGNNPRYELTASFCFPSRASYPRKYGREKVSNAGRSPFGTSTSTSTRFRESIIREIVAETNWSLGRVSIELTERTRAKGAAGR